MSDKNKPFPKCAETCDIVKHLGAGECESVCSGKFDKNGNPRGAIMSTPKTKHTPTPWKYDEDSIAVIGRDNYEIATTPMAGRRIKENEANAAFIVTACNFHEELVIAIRGFVNLVDNRSMSHDTIMSMYQQEFRSLLSRIESEA